MASERELSAFWQDHEDQMQDPVYAKAYTDAVERLIRLYDPLPGEEICVNGFMSHEMWFGLMRHYDLDWACPACKAQI